MNFQWNSSERSPNISFPIVKRRRLSRVSLEKLFLRNVHFSAIRVFFLGRNWIVVTDSDQESKNFISDTHTFRHLSRTIIEKSCLATDERERTKISIEEDFYARNLDKGRFDREWEIKCWNGNYETKSRDGHVSSSFFLPKYRWTRYVEKFLALDSNDRDFWNVNVHGDV